jgi:uncharacterized protein DUF4440
MSEDERTLKDLNVAIGDAENRGDRDELSKMLAPRLAFQRADDARTVDDAVAFLQKVASGGTRLTRVIEPIEVYGDRAIVKCVVTAADKREFHNIRLFVRRDGQWKLLGWANEPS